MTNVFIFLCMKTSAGELFVIGSGSRKNALDTLVYYTAFWGLRWVGTRKGICVEDTSSSFFTHYDDQILRK